jgi:DNA polymerase III delta subunit
VPQDRRFNPLALNPYVLYKALPQANRYTQAELVRAMDLLLNCNRQLVSSALDESLVLQQALIQIVGTPSSARSGDRARGTVPG